MKMLWNSLPSASFWPRYFCPVSYQSSRILCNGAKLQYVCLRLWYSLWFVLFLRFLHQKLQGPVICFVWWQLHSLASLTNVCLSLPHHLTKDPWRGMNNRKGNVVHIDNFISNRMVYPTLYKSLGWISISKQYLCHVTEMFYGSGHTRTGQTCTGQIATTRMHPS